LRDQPRRLRLADVELFDGGLDCGGGVGCLDLAEVLDRRKSNSSGSAEQHKSLARADKTRCWVAPHMEGNRTLGHGSPSQ
jgi:hypothetical protein